jgi:hypothetical protein
MFGLENIGKQTVAETTQKLDPLLRDVENRAAGILHGLLDRLNGTTITLKIAIPGVEKAETRTTES